VNSEAGDEVLQERRYSGSIGKNMTDKGRANSESTNLMLLT
jgi:hypothetical protein